MHWSHISLQKAGCAAVNIQVLSGELRNNTTAQQYDCTFGCRHSSIDALVRVRSQHPRQRLQRQRGVPPIQGCKQLQRLPRPCMLLCPQRQRLMCTSRESADYTAGHFIMLCWGSALISCLSQAIVGNYAQECVLTCAGSLLRISGRVAETSAGQLEPCLASLVRGSASSSASTAAMSSGCATAAATYTTRHRDGLTACWRSANTRPVMLRMQQEAAGWISIYVQVMPAEQSRRGQIGAWQPGRRPRRQQQTRPRFRAPIAASALETAGNQ
jgi:hypothetical protein